MESHVGRSFAKVPSSLSRPSEAFAGEHGPDLREAIRFRIRIAEKQGVGLLRSLKTGMADCSDPLLGVDNFWGYMGQIVN